MCASIRSVMRIPYRKPGKFSQMKPDPMMTEAKFGEIKKKLEKLKAGRPQAAAEVARLAELGDFSENAEYQLAKGKLRGMNSAILSLEHQLNQAEIIPLSSGGDVVHIGSTVTVEIEGQKKIYQILGSSEANPSKGVISYNSPIGAALMGKSVGESVAVTLGKKEVEYKILSIK